MRLRKKTDWIIPLVRDKKVLDLGCVQHDLSRLENPEWLHDVISKHAGSTLGVDCLQEGVTALNKLGYNVINSDVQTMQLGGKFDVVVAGDIIEHLSNCGQFLKRVHEHLTTDGLFLVSTPNPIHFLRFVELLFKGQGSPNPEHTCWFTRSVLSQLAGRFGFEIVDVTYIDNSYQWHNLGSLWLPFLLLNYVLCLVRPQFSETLCFVLRKT